MDAALQFCDEGVWYPSAFTPDDWDFVTQPGWTFQAYRVVNEHGKVVRLSRPTEGETQ